VIAAEEKRNEAVTASALDLRGDPPARLEDLVDESGALGATRTGLRKGGLDVPAVLDVETGRFESVAEPCVPDRGRPHVHAAAARAEVQSSSDDRHAASRLHDGTLVGRRHTGRIDRVLAGDFDVL
jgi:hypothetical protein